MFENAQSNDYNYDISTLLNTRGFDGRRWDLIISFRGIPCRSVYFKC